MRHHYTLRNAAAVLAIAGLVIFGQSILQTGSDNAAAQQNARGNAMQTPGMPNMPMQPAAPAAQPITKAVCMVHALGDSQVKGKVTFTKQADGVLVTAEITGLTPGDHGFHVHQWGDVSSTDGTSTGGHFNPAGMQHGRPDADERHAGDFGNLTADAQGNAKYSRVDKTMMLEGPTSVIGRGIIIHADPDDYSQPTGNAGGRIACGVIGIANPEAN